MLLGITAHAQNNRAPYSRFAMGELYPEQFTSRWSMGGVSLAHHSPFSYALQNPASLGYLKQTTFNVGGYNLTRYARTSNSEAENAQQGVSYLALAFPIEESLHMAGGFNLRPLTQTDFLFEEDRIQVVDGDSTRLSERVTGSGGLSQFSLQFGAKILPRWALGVEAGFIFGNISLDNQQGVIGPDAAVNNLFFISESERNTYQGFSWQGGLQYTQPLSNERRMVFGLQYRPGVRLRREQERDLLSRPVSGGGFQDTITSSSSQARLEVLPERIGLGVQYHFAPRHFLAFEGHSQAWSEIEGAPFDNNPPNSWQLRLGYAITPEPDAVRGYLKRIHYRVGARFRQTQIQVEGEQIQEFAVSLGWGFPLNQTRSNVNLGIEFGQRGQTANELLQERLLRFQLGLTLNDEWFKSRKIQ